MKIKVTISGTTGLLMNRFGEASEVAVGTGTSQAVVGSKGSPREQADPKAYKDQDGYLYVPGPNIFAALIQAGTFHKTGKKQVTTVKTSLVPAGLTVEEIICPLGTKEWEVDTRSVVNPSTQGRRICHRPRIDNWSLSFTLDVDTTVFDPKFVRVLVDDAGKKIGLGDFRPAKKGPFGKFVVTGWEEVKEKKAA